MIWLYWLYFLLLLATDVAGLVLAAFTLPGLWLMLGGAAVFAWLTHGYFLGWRTLVALLVLTVTAEIGEFVLGGAGAKKAGASKWGMTGGLLGAIVGGFTLTGLVPIPILGTVVGICLGSFIGAFAVEMMLGSPIQQSLRIGVGAAKGKLTGILGKVGIGCVMAVVTFFMAFPLKSRVHPRSVPPRANATMPATTRAIR